jgi:hypothetical protein
MATKDVIYEDKQTENDKNFELDGKKVHLHAALC